MAGIIAFGGFAAVAAVTVVGGEATCGCFEVYQVSPLVALAFDLAVVAAGLLCSPRRGGGALFC